MNIPGFTAETSLYKRAGHYNELPRTSNAQAATMITPALDNRANDDPVVDCKTFPDAITCHECNSFGPGTLDCCFPRPGHGCIIINDPNERTGGKPPISRFSQSVNRNLSRRLVF